MTDDPKLIGSICGRFVAPALAILTGVLVYCGSTASTSRGLFVAIASACLTAFLCGIVLPAGLNAVNRLAVAHWRNQWVEAHIPGFCKTLVENEDGLEVLRQTDPTTVGGRIASKMLLKFCSLKAATGRSLYEEHDMHRKYENTIRRELHRQVVFLRNRTLPENRRDFFQQMNQYTQRFDPSTIAASNVSKAHYFRDPIYGSVRLDKNLSEFVLHPVIQRLNEIRQLGFAFTSFPSATHTRLAHSIGVSYLASQVMQRVLHDRVLYTMSGKENIDLGKEEIEKLIFKASLCGLIHDVSHCAFGHTVDRLLAGFIGRSGGDLLKEVKSVDKRMFGRLTAVHLGHLIERHFDIDEIIQIVTGQTASIDGDADPWDYFISMLINSDADVDRIDYLSRDALFTSEPSGTLNVPALINAIRPWKGEDQRIYMTFAEDFVSVVEDLILARDLMYLRCYDSSSKLVGEWLALRSVNMVLDKIPEIKDHLDSFILLTDAQIPELLSSCPQDFAHAERILRSALCSGAHAYEEVASVPLSKDAVADILGPVYNYWLSNHPMLVKAVRAAEEKLADEVGCPWEHVLITLPAPNAVELRDTNIFLLRREDGGGFSTVPLTGQGRGENPGAAAEYPSPLMRPIRVIDESTEEERRVTLSSFAVMERARIRLFATGSLDGNSIERLRQAFARMCPKCRPTPVRLHD